MKRLILGLVLFQLATHVSAGVDVLSIRIWHSPLRTRLVFDLSGPVVYSVFALADPQRIVIDLKDTVSSAVSPRDQTLGPWLLAMRSGNPSNGVLRYVLDLKAQLGYDSFLLPPGAVYGVQRATTGSRTDVPILLHGATTPARAFHSTHPHS